MHHDIKQTLETINEISRQILSCILSMHEETRENIAPTLKVEAKIDDDSSNEKVTTEHDISEMMSKREKLIHIIFEQKTIEEISLERNLLNEMVSLDTKLSAQSKIYKKMLSDQVIKLKKSQKVKNVYQKY